MSGVVNSRDRLCLVAVVLMGVLSGCSSENTVALVPSKGIVKIKGKPAAGIMVRMVPEVKTSKGAISGEGGLASSGVTNDAGEFRLIATDNRDGAVAGPARVLLTDTLEERPAQGETASAPPRIDGKYGVLGTESITVEVKGGEEPIVIEVP